MTQNDFILRMIIANEGATEDHTRIAFDKTIDDFVLDANGSYWVKTNKDGTIEYDEYDDTNDDWYKKEGYQRVSIKLHWYYRRLALYYKEVSTVISETLE